MGQRRLERLEKGIFCALDTIVVIYFLEHHPIHYEILRMFFFELKKEAL